MVERQLTWRGGTSRRIPRDLVKNGPEWWDSLGPRVFTAQPWNSRLVAVVGESAGIVFFYFLGQRLGDSRCPSFPLSSVMAAAEVVEVACERPTDCACRAHGLR